jgi:hypothetical protein
MSFPRAELCDAYSYQDAQILPRNSMVSIRTWVCLRSLGHTCDLETIMPFDVRNICIPSREKCDGYYPVLKVLCSLTGTSVTCVVDESGKQATKHEF